MNVKELYIEAKKSKNFQTYTVAKTMIIEEGDDIEVITKQTQAWCRKRCVEQIEADFFPKETNI